MAGGGETSCKEMRSISAAILPNSSLSLFVSVSVPLLPAAPPADALARELVSASANRSCTCSRTQIAAVRS